MSTAPLRRCSRRPQQSGPQGRLAREAVSDQGQLKAENVAEIVSSFAEVNHNYEREHHFNLWFVVVADDEDRLQSVLAEIEDYCGYPVLDLPLLNEYFIDLGFNLKWTRS